MYIHMCNLLRIKIQKWLIRDKKLVRINQKKDNGHFFKEKFLRNIRIYMLFLKKS
jgi:hypothetical protein